MAAKTSDVMMTFLCDTNIFCDNIEIRSLEILKSLLFRRCFEGLLSVIELNALAPQLAGLLDQLTVKFQSR